MSKIKTHYRYKGYINYYIKDDPHSVKTYHFQNKKGSEVRKLQEQFQNEKKYIYKGILKVKDRESMKKLNH